MDWNLASDIARVLGAVELLGMLILMIREARHAADWTHKGMGIFIFEAAFKFSVLVALIERVAVDAEPGLAIFAVPVVCAFGLCYFARRGPMGRPPIAR